MKRTLCVSSLCVAQLVALGACGVGGGGGIGPPVNIPFDLTVEDGGSFGGPHPGHRISVAVVAVMGDVVLAQKAQTVSPNEDVAFSFIFLDVLVGGFNYEVHYWIDSNVGGGRTGRCDAEVNDHQGSVAISAQGDVLLLLDHDDDDLTFVCPSFQ